MKKVDFYRECREKMVKCQLRPNDIQDSALIERFLQVPREKFLPNSLRDSSYIDDNITIDHNEIMLSPLNLAKLIKTAQIKETDVVLIMGCSTGYTAAIVSALCSTVFSLTEDKKTSEQISKRLEELNIDNCITLTGNLSEGFPNQAPYDAILIPCGLEERIETVEKQLNDKGRLVTILSKNPYFGGEMICVESHHGNTSCLPIECASAPIYEQKKKESVFQF